MDCHLDRQGNRVQEIESRGQLLIRGGQGTCHSSFQGMLHFERSELLFRQRSMCCYANQRPERLQTSSQVTHNITACSMGELIGSQGNRLLDQPSLYFVEKHVAEGSALRRLRSSC